MITIGFLGSSKSLVEKIKNKIKLKIKSTLNIGEKNRTILETAINKNGFIECRWKLNDQDKKDLLNPRIICLGIRVFDITNKILSKQSTCVMKETEVNKNISEFLMQAPVNDGVLLIEIGYRVSGREWKKFTNSTLKLGQRKLRDVFLDDSWFYLSPSSTKIPDSLHERLYQLSNHSKLGGSERIQTSKIGGSEKVHKK